MSFLQYKLYLSIQIIFKNFSYEKIEKTYLIVLKINGNVNATEIQ